MTDDFSEDLASLSADMTDISDILEGDLEAILDHPCTVTIEDIDTETGEVTLQAELDLSTLREQLEEQGGYEDIEFGIDDDFSFRIWPTDQQ